MSGASTMFTFDPAKVFSGVHKQQGRVSLDADFNEFEEILDRRDRSTAYDTFGKSVVPSTTPDAFKIGVSGSNITIGVGRAYVDGIQAECFGDLTTPSAAQFDPAIGSLAGSAPLVFTAQPFLYGPPNAPSFPAISATAGTINLVYLDVWQREVTAWEDEGLLDPALGGADTATRIQTAWQVKALPGVNADACTNPSAAWTGLIAPSTARMTAEASAAPPAPQPCVIQPAGGYTGLENRLYRVEIHKAGTLGGATKATFVWSRDNASLVASVEKITGSGTSSTIKVESTGRDTWMRFEVSQQVELLDDAVELSLREKGIGGPIARITNVNHATGEITVDQNLSTFAIVKAQHPRIRRWDTAAPADAAERNVENGIQLPLEEGIKISFGDGTAGDNGDTLHAGDYWVFAARTANGEIDVVDSAPPRGILHHFMPLAIVTSGATPTVDPDCRNPWPVPCECEGGGCECDWCVTLESHESNTLTVQDAIKNAIAAGGGTVCIGPGYYRLDGPGLVISDVPAIRVHGAGVTTVLEYTGEDPALRIERAIDVYVRDLVIVTQRTAELPFNAIDLSDAGVVTLERLGVVEDPAALLEAVEIGTSSRPVGAAIALHGILVAATIRDCLLIGGSGVVVPTPSEDDPEPYLATADLEIDDNVIFATEHGIRFDGSSEGASIVCLDRLAFTSNSIYGCWRSGITLIAVGPWGAIDTRAVVSGSTLGVVGDGIVVGLDGTAIEGNNVLALAPRTLINDRGARGLSLVRGTEALLGDVRVDANRIAGFLGGGVVIDARVKTLNVTDNQIHNCGGGVVMSFESSGERVVVRGNSILGLPFTTLDGSQEAFGISLVLATRGEIIDNHVQQFERELTGIGGVPA
jgi:Family of unknown function (DUF6519)